MPMSTDENAPSPEYANPAEFPRLAAYGFGAWRLKSAYQLGKLPRKGGQSQAPGSILPKAIEPERVHFCVARGIGNLFVSEIGGECARIDALVDEFKAAGIA
jgi:hypothetical protein